MARRRIRRLLFSATLFFAAAAAGTGVFAWMRLNAPYPGTSADGLVEIPKGASTREIAHLLAQRGIVRSEWDFLAVRFVRPRSVLQAGEYSFDRAVSPLEAYDKIARGDIYHFEFTVTEGSNLFDIAAHLESQGIYKAADFRKAAFNTKVIHDIAPQATNLEGYLFPATYRLTRHTAPEALVREMTNRFRRAWKEAGGESGVHRAVTLASLVEKETAVPEERPLVASVYANRLERGIKLDCDPTTIYAALLENRYRGTIYRSDLASEHPYNTYVHAGLPPGPIANPGLASLKAALNPARTDFVFFVARPDGSGGHVFSTRLEDHNKAVSDYRRGQQKGKATNGTRGVSGTRKAGGD